MKFNACFMCSSIIMFITAASIYANTVPAVFKNSWFINRPESKDVTFYTNQCDSRTYTYSYLEETIDLAALDAYSLLPKNKACHWTIGKHVLNSDAIPVSFPGQESQWNDIVAKNSTKRDEETPPVTKIYTFNCVGSDNKTKLSKQIKIYPLYKCKPGSRQGSYPTTGCFTNPPLCDADVLGRDLATKHDYKQLGHVALAIGSGSASDPKDNYVLEVLGDKQLVINVDSFQSFAFNPKGPFWGEVYAPYAYPKVTYTQASNILNSGGNMADYDPIYTLLPWYHEGAYVKTYVFDPDTFKFNLQYTLAPAVFRCDTFIVYSYLKGANIRIETLTPFSSPESLYNNEFEKSRKAFPISIKASTQNIWTKDETYKNTACSTSTCYQEEINSLLAILPLNSDQISNALDGLVKLENNAETSNNYIYQLAEKYPDNSPQKNILMQELVKQKPTGIMDKIVTEYQASEANNVMPLIGRSLLLTSIPSTGTKDVGELKAIEDSQKLIVHILKTSNNKNEVYQTINFMENVLPNNQEYFMLAANAAKRVGIDPNAQPLINLLTGQLLTPLNGKGTSISTSINKFASKYHISKDKLKRNALIHLQVIPIRTYPINFKNKFIRFIQKNQPTGLPQDRSFGTSFRYFLNWVSTAKNILQLNKIETDALIIKTLTHFKDPKVAARVFLSYYTTHFKDVTPKLLNKFKASLHTASLTAKPNSNITGAINNIELTIEKYHANKAK